MATFLNTLVSFITTSLVLALAALGLAVIFGLVGVINMGHGAMLTVGAYITWDASSHGVPFFAAIILSAVATGVLGALFEWSIIRHFYQSPFETLLITWGFYLIVTEVIKIVWGTDIHSVSNPTPGAWSFGGMSIPKYNVVLSVITLTVLGFAAWVFYRTDIGIRVRATIQNKEMASLLAINVTRMYSQVFIVGAALAGLAGGLISPSVSVDPDFGALWLVRSFFVVIVGGVGQILSGTLLGSVLIGGLTTVFSLFFKQVFAQTVVFALAVVALRFRPSGLLGRRQA